MGDRIAEELYAEAFLEGVGWPRTPGDVKRPDVRRPDFLFRADSGRTVGIEVTNLFAGPLRRGGSTMRENESRRSAWLMELAARYYDHRGVAIQLQVSFSGPGTPQLMDVVEARLHTEGSRLEPWARATIPLYNERDSRLGTLWLTRLPDSEVGYRRGWQNMANSIGWMRRLSAERLQRTIDSKARLLPGYRGSVADVVLLAVADHMRASGMVMFDPAGQLDAHGSNSVYLLHFPDRRVDRIA